jgi:hypothetical protein
MTIAYPRDDKYINHSRTQCHDDKLDYCHPQDDKWVREQLSKLPPGSRMRAIEGYKTIKNRQEANTRLRLFVKNTLHSNQ